MSTLTFGRTTLLDRKHDAFWGARAIYKDSDFSLVHDRQSSHGDDDRLRELCDWLHTSGLERLRDRLRKDYVSPMASDVVGIAEGHFYLEASPQTSGGYLYIGAVVCPDSQE